MPPPTYTAADPPPSLARPVLGERTARDAPERRGTGGKLFALLLVIGLGVAAWYYQEPLATFSTDLVTEVQTRMDAERAPSDRASVPAPSAGDADAPLATAPAITDPEPAMVLAPGANVPAETKSAVPAAREPATAPPAAKKPATAPPKEPVATREEPVAAAPRPPAPVIPSPDTAVQAPMAAAPAPSMPAATAGPTSFAFQQDLATVREGDVAARISIRRSGNLSGSASVSWWTEEGTARADADYADLGARIERFEPGEASRTVYVPLTNDSMREPSKSFRVLLGRGEGTDIAADMRVDIVDDD